MDLHMNPQIETKYRSYSKAFAASITEYHYDIRYGNWVAHIISETPPDIDVVAITAGLKALHEFNENDFYGCPGRAPFEWVEEQLKECKELKDVVLALGVTKVTNEAKNSITC